MPPKKRISAEIVNIYDEVDSDLLPVKYNPNFDLHHIDLPFRMIVAAASGSGKTNMIYNLIRIMSTGKGTFASINICTRNKDEALYNQMVRSTKGAVVITEGMNTLPRLDSFDASEAHLVVVDDLVLEKNQTAIESYFVRCRKLGVSVIYISQSYFRIPKIIRENASYVAFLKAGSKRSLSLCLGEYGFSVDLPTIIQMYNYATSVKFQPFLIDLGADPQHQFRQGFTTFLNPDDFECECDGKGPRRALKKQSKNSDEDDSR